MNILVLNGSPKGDYSVTVKTVEFMAKHNCDHKFTYLNVAKRIRQYEKDFSEAAKCLNEADLIVFSFPVYTFIAPSQLHRFIELMKASGIDFSGKFATTVTTSKHFYDVTAHNYIRDNAQDMGFKYINGLSADMDDLLSTKGRKEALAFFKYVCWCIKMDKFEKPKSYSKEAAHKQVSMRTERLKREGKISIVADLAEDDVQLAAMIERFKLAAFTNVEVYNIHDFKFQGGCISCFNCATSGKCIYKDGFDNWLRENIQDCDAIVVAFSIKDHSMGSLFKTYDDRQFCNGHRTVTQGTPFGYLVSGNISEEENLRMVIEGRAEVGKNFLCGVASDEVDPDKEIDQLAATIEFAMRNKYTQPSNFLGVGGTKIFRDLIYLMQGMMKEDHRFYKKNKMYDFPQKKKGTMIGMYLVGGLMGNKKLKAKMGNKMNEGMIMPYKKVVEKY